MNNKKHTSKKIYQRIGDSNLKKLWIVRETPQNRHGCDGDVLIIVSEMTAWKWEYKKNDDTIIYARKNAPFSAFLEQTQSFSTQNNTWPTPAQLIDKLYLFDYVLLDWEQKYV